MFADAKRGSGLLNLSFRVDKNVEQGYHYCEAACRVLQHSCYRGATLQRLRRVSVRGDRIRYVVFSSTCL